MKNRLLLTPRLNTFFDHIVISVSSSIAVFFSILSNIQFEFGRIRVLSLFNVWGMITRNRCWKHKTNLNKLYDSQVCERETLQFTSRRLSSWTLDKFKPCTWRAIAGPRCGLYSSAGYTHETCAKSKQSAGYTRGAAYTWVGATFKGIR